jgi:hypothetical protein
MAELDRIAKISDLEEQGRAVAELLRTLDVAKRRAVALRREVVLRLRANDRSHAEVAEIILLDRGTAAQIAAGKQTGRKSAQRAVEDHPTE